MCQASVDLMKTSDVPSDVKFQGFSEPEAHIKSCTSLVCGKFSHYLQGKIQVLNMAYKAIDELGCLPLVLSVVSLTHSCDVIFKYSYARLCFLPLLRRYMYYFINRQNFGFLLQHKGNSSINTLFHFCRLIFCPICSFMIVSVKQTDRLMEHKRKTKRDSNT